MRSSADCRFLDAKRLRHEFHPQRRQFLKTSLLAAGTAALGPAFPGAIGAEDKKQAATGSLPTRGIVIAGAGNLFELRAALVDALR